LYGAELSAGALVGPYVVKELIHRGGVANLYRAREDRTQRAAAVKVLHPQFSHLSKVLRRFQQEADSLRQLRHPNIVEILVSGELRDGRPFIAMEWLSGQSIAADLQLRGPYSARELLSALEQIGAALSAAHAIGIVHRDIKAQNVMVIRDAHEPIYKVVDFGIAKLLTPTASGGGLTSTGMMMGTPVSMAPEQIRGEGADARTDIYALGVLIYQLATGRLPFQGSSSIEIEEMHLYAEAPRPSEAAAVPLELDRLVARCLQKRPEERYPNVDALLEHLRSAVAEQGGRSSQLCRALGLFVQVLSPAEEMVDELGSALEHAQSICRAGGLSISIEAENAFLATRVLPHAEPDEQKLREQVVRMAIDLFGELRARFPALHFSCSLNAASGQLQKGRQEKAEIAAGELLALTRWVSDSEGVTATRPAIANLESHFAVAPIADRTDSPHVQLSIGG
jgi:serine/threonine-protein kinase